MTNPLRPFRRVVARLRPARDQAEQDRRRAGADERAAALYDRHRAGVSGVSTRQAPRGRSW